MRYFIQNGDEADGPFLLEELRSQNLTRDTMVWYNGLYQWTKACELLELIDLFERPDPNRKTIADLMNEMERNCCL
jgi:hypothetical protein